MDQQREDDELVTEKKRATLVDAQVIPTQQYGSTISSTSIVSTSTAGTSTTINNSGSNQSVEVVPITCANQALEIVTAESTYAELKTLPRRPQFISVTLLKQSKNDAIGVGVTRQMIHEDDDDEGMVITSISPHGLLRAAIAPTSFRGTDGRPESLVCLGDVVEFINGISVHDKTASFAANLIRKSDDKVTLQIQAVTTASAVAERRMSTCTNPELACSVIYKPTAETKLGIGLVHVFNNVDDDKDNKLLQQNRQYQQQKQQIHISSVGGLISHSLLRVGSAVLSVNGASTHDMATVTEAIKLIKTTVGPLTIMTAVDDPCHRPALVSATIYKSNAGSRVGIGIQPVPKGRHDDDQDELSTNLLEISSIDPRGPLLHTPLRNGDTLVSINHVNCFRHPTRDAAFCTKLIRSAPSSVTIVARVADGIPNRVAYSIAKLTPETQIGIGVARRGHTLIVSSIFDSGLVANSILNVGDRVLEINGFSCDSNMTAAMAVHLIKTAPERVTFVLQTIDETGLVLAVSERATKR